VDDSSGASRYEGRDESGDDDADPGLPASIEAAWGLRGRPHRGPRPGLSIERIVDAAVRVASAEGLAAVSMSRVAAELGTGPMSLYRYVGAKDELLALMVDAALGPPPDLKPEEGWRAGLAGWAWAERAAYQRHQWTLRVPISGPPMAPNQIAWLERGLACLRDTGLAEGTKLGVIMLVSGYVRNEVTIAADLAAGFQAADAPVQRAMAAYGRTLARLTDPVRFPALHAVIAAGVFEGEDDPDHDFVFGLERVLDGIEVLVGSGPHPDR
jgi:AcrR family transcriptional regulator